MLSENIIKLRKAKGLTQEELAIRLNVVRQTVSKWEKGLSVPDAELLLRMAEVFEVPVSRLLGAAAEADTEIGSVAEQLSRINEQLAIKNRRSHRIWKTVGIVLVTLIALQILLFVLNMVSIDAMLRGSTTVSSSNSEVLIKE